MWCAFGVAALCAPGAHIHTRFGAERAGVVLDATSDAVVHFPIPPRDAWNNVVHWCSTVQPFARVEDVAPWCARHASPLGAIVPLAQVRTLAERWYGRHLDPAWKKWSLAEAQAHFEDVGLIGERWRLPAGDQRY